MIIYIYDKNKGNNIKINKIKSWFLEKITKIDKLLNPSFIQTKKRREGAQSNKIRNEKEATTDNTEIQMIIKTNMSNCMTIN